MAGNFLIEPITDRSSPFVAKVRLDAKKEKLLFFFFAILLKARRSKFRYVNVPVFQTLFYLQKFK